MQIDIGFGDLVYPNPKFSKIGYPGSQTTAVQKNTYNFGVHWNVTVLGMMVLVHI